SGLLKQEARVASISAPGIQDPLAAAHIKGARTNQPARQGFVSCDETRDRGESTGQAIVMVSDEAAVVEEGAPTRHARFEDCTQARLNGGTRRFLGSIHGRSIIG